MSHVTHDTFTIERVVDASPERVFQALAQADVKSKWFAGPPGWKQHERTFDFRVGGVERLSGTHASGLSSAFGARYLDIVPNQRVVYVYEMTVNGEKISASLATFELVRQGDKTKIVLTEQGAYFEDAEMKTYAPKGQAASRHEGTLALMDKLAAIFAA
ncbi:MAG TPA: SRPBCC family protein [Polyangiaceae bacterium]|jgi:uncharacterized protein YndB with AHSA1/START domain